MNLRTIKEAVFRLWTRAGAPLISIGANRGFVASAYYALFSRAFWREQQAFLAGRRRYSLDQANPAESAVLLRRNVHRLEKGLLMRPRRVPFARDYIEETVTCLERTGRSSDRILIDPEERKWAEDVLSDYFAVMPQNPFFDQLRRRFREVARPDQEAQPRYVPYHRNLSEPPSVTYDQLLKLAQRRRSVRWFLQDPVPRELIDRAVVVASQSPSACNRQPFQFRIIDDPTLREQVVRIPFGLDGYGDNVPVLVVVVGRQRSYFHERDRHLIYIDASLATMAFLFALESQGLSSCCINWPDLEDRERRIARVLRLESDERPIMLVAVGYPDPDGLVAYSQKRSLDQSRIYNLPTS